MAPVAQERGHRTPAGRHTAPLLAGVALATAGAGTVGAGPRPHVEAVADILGTALALEHVSAAVYYAGLTTPAVLRTPALCGGSSNPNDPGLPPNGHPQQVRYLQAALDAEIKHAALLDAAGARGHVTRLYVPARALARLGSSGEPDSFLGLLDRLETTAVGLYTAAVEAFLLHGRRDLALLAAQMAGVESEHRMLGRAIAGLRPANNLTLAPRPFATVAEAAAALHPFLTGKHLAGAVRALAVPTSTQAARVIGKYGTRRVRWYL
ncbi:MAG TPA: ferritin-like domain-containing protein [Chloroflexota bacterium]|nr:ferritin-like domain-containing protein [Chloroflexota bacterium]